MSDEQELRDDTPPKPDDETWQMGDPPEEGKEGATTPGPGRRGCPSCWLRSAAAITR